jgi:hypothetical protein
MLILGASVLLALAVARAVGRYTLKDLYREGLPADQPGD